MWRKTLTVNLLAPAWTTKWNWGSEDSVGVGERQWGPLAHIHILDKDLIPLLFNTVMSYLNLHNSLVMPTSVYPASHHQLFELCGIVQELILSSYGRVWLKKNSLETRKHICHIDNGKLPLVIVVSLIQELHAVSTSWETKIGLSCLLMAWLSYLLHLDEERGYFHIFLSSIHRLDHEHGCINQLMHPEPI